MRASRTLTTLAVLAALTTLTACGAEESPTADATDSTTLPTGEDETTVLDICTLVTEAEVGTIVGGTVTKKDVPGGGCSFDQEDPRATSIAFAVTAYDEGTGGFDGAVTGMSAQYDGTDDQEVPGVGTEALVSVGTVMGSATLKGGGLVHVGGSLVQVTVLQATGLTADAVRTIAVDALTLAAGKG